MNQEMLEQVLNCPSLPTLPAVAVRVLELTQRPNVSMDEIAATIQNDQGLSAKILKTVNSSFYGVRRPCSTINQAIVMLGMSAVKSLALSFSLVSAVNQDGSSEFDYPSYWRRGLYTAVAAKCIAHEAGLATEDEAFVGGLLQDVGMVGMFRGLSRKYLEVMLRAGEDHRKLVRHELAEFELQHPDVGAMMCERWRLPQELIMPVRFHERPTAAPEEHADIVRCVGLGNLAHDILTEGEPAESVRRFQDRARQWFDIDAASCNALIRRIAESTKQVSSLFRLNIGTAADVEGILERAQQRLDELAREAEQPRSHGANLNSLLSDSDEYDALTGVWTSRAALAAAEDSFRLARNAGRNLSVIVVALDGFLHLADHSGQEAADAAMVETAALLSDFAIPLGGSVARWENASFAVVMPGIDKVESVRHAGELRAMLPVSSASWDLAGAKHRALTLSVGSATLTTQESAFAKVQQLFTAASRAMEAAAGSGGNCVRAFVPKVAA